MLYFFTYPITLLYCLFELWHFVMQIQSSFFIIIIAIQDHTSDKSKFVTYNNTWNDQIWMYKLI